ncbi:sigma-70 family RNA polymerase sigma factor [Paenibacillus sp. Marseille-Q4541]|uniref:RNA polymerase sigma factor n=1 Tax=Paenibacillus sp. Marseille-Q4541 TaxID=2831522 RepID=UPI0032D58EE3
MEETINQAKKASFDLLNEEQFIKYLSGQQRKLYSIAYSYLRNEADAIEVIQEATCRAWLKRKKLNSEESFTPWLIRITINCCMDELRRKKRVFPVGKWMDEPAHEMKNNDRIDLERAMDQMKNKYRHVVMLKYYQDMTIPEIAKILQKPEGTIKTWVREGLKQLRKYL